MPKPAASVHPIHFEDLNGSEFERLVFAYHWRTDAWRSLEWYGQTGSDLGRDIWGVREDSETVCIQCVNRKQLTFNKTATDIAKVLKAPNGVPHRFRIVAQMQGVRRTAGQNQEARQITWRQGVRYMVRPRV